MHPEADEQAAKSMVRKIKQKTKNTNRLALKIGPETVRDASVAAPQINLPLTLMGDFFRWKNRS